MLKKAEETYRHILSAVPAGSSRIERLDQDRNKRILLNRSPDWMSLYYLLHSRAPQLNEGYWLRDDKGVFRADLYQGRGPDGESRWESIDDHPEFHESFRKILDWAISVVPEEIAKHAADQNEKDKQRKKSLDKLTAILKTVNFRDMKALVELIVPSAVTQDAAFWSQWAESFSNPESFLDGGDNTYKLSRGFSFTMERLVEQRCAVWVDWKDIETLDFQTQQLLETYSVPAPESLFSVAADDVPTRIQRVADFLRPSPYRLAQIDTGGDDYLFVLTKAGGAAGIDRTFKRLKELKLIPKEFTIGAIS
jgi:hypothetical protein